MSELLKNVYTPVTTMHCQNTANASSAQYCTSTTMVQPVICPLEISEQRTDVTYGNVTHFEYYSNTTQCMRGANALLPSNYNKEKKYPVLYFLHGIFGDENSMIMEPNNRIKEIIGNLNADNLCKDIIVIFPNMYASSDKTLTPAFNAEQTAPYDNFINDLTCDLIPYVESHYHTMTDRMHRAIIGFSMGGRETLFIGLMRSDLFDYIGAVAPAPGLTPAKDWAMEHPGQLSEENVIIKNPNYIPKLLMICCGTNDKIVGNFPSNYHRLFIKNNVQHLWYEIPEADHDTTALKSGVFNFLIRCFK